MKGCRALKTEEIVALLNELGIREKVFALTGLTFGLRISESLALTFNDVVGEYLEVKSKKGSDNVTFPIPSTYKIAVNNLRKWYHQHEFTILPDTPLFLNCYGNRISKVGVHKQLKKACGLLTILGKVNSHSFRKNFVTAIYGMTGKDLVQTKVYSRHKSLANLDYYIQVSQETALINNLSW